MLREIVIAAITATAGAVASILVTKAWMKRQDQKRAAPPDRPPPPP